MMPRPRSAGFTLVELLIALALTALVLAAAFAAFGLIGRSTDTATLLRDRSERMMLVERFLRDKLEGMRQVKRFDNGRPVVFFSGNSAGLLWVAPLPERPVGGGLHVLRLGPERHPDGRTDWVLEILPFQGAYTTFDWPAAERIVLLENLSTLRWQYFDNRTGQWLDEWTDPAFNPGRLRHFLGAQGQEWPVLVFALDHVR